MALGGNTESSNLDSVPGEARGGEEVEQPSREMGLLKDSQQSGEQKTER